MPRFIVKVREVCTHYVSVEAPSREVAWLATDADSLPDLCSSNESFHSVDERDVIDVEEDTGAADGPPDIVLDADGVEVCSDDDEQSGE